MHDSRRVVTSQIQFAQVRQPSMLVSDAPNFHESRLRSESTEAQQ